MRVTAMVVAALLTAACNSGSQAADDASDGTLTWRVGRHLCTTDCGFLEMAEEKGFFDKYGVDVEYVDIQSGTQIMSAVVGREVDSIEASPGALFIAAEQGDVGAKVIGSTLAGLSYAIYAKSEYETLADLKGGSLAISSPSGLPALAARLMFEAEGVDYDSLQLVNGGGNADRYRAVVAGTVDAASSPATYIPNAESDGLNVVALSTETIPDYPQYTVIANNDSLRENGEAATRYLAGVIEGIRYAYGHPDEAKQIAADATETTADDPAIEFMYDHITEYQLADPDARIRPESLDFMEKVLLDSGELTGEVDMDALADDSYVSAALELVDANGPAD